MAKLILPASYKTVITSRDKVIRTGLNAPKSAMKVVRVPESMRKTYTKLAKNKDWYSKDMIGFIQFLPDKVYKALQVKRTKRRLYENGHSQLGMEIDIDT